MRYVIHFHSGAGDHYDFMIEHGPALLTWRIAPDDLDPFLGGSEIHAERIGDHRRAYLDYEGPVSCDRGMVRLVESGTVEESATAEGECRFRLAGERMRGTVEMKKVTDTVYLLCYHTGGNPV